MTLLTLCLAQLSCLLPYASSFQDERVDERCQEFSSMGKDFNLLVLYLFLLMVPVFIVLYVDLAATKRSLAALNAEMADDLSTVRATILEMKRTADTDRLVQQKLAVQTHHDAEGPTSSVTPTQREAHSSAPHRLDQPSTSTMRTTHHQQ